MGGFAAGFVITDLMVARWGGRMQPSFADRKIGRTRRSGVFIEESDVSCSTFPNGILEG